MCSRGEPVVVFVPRYIVEVLEMQEFDKVASCDAHDDGMLKVHREVCTCSLHSFLLNE